MGRTYIGYARVSTKRQGQSGLGLEAQIDAIRRHVASVGGRLLETMEEVESGTHDSRPVLGQALKQCRLTGSILVIARLDRLSRNAAFLFKLRDSDIEFVCCDMPAANRLTIGIMALVAEQERELISRRTREALAVKRIQLAEQRETAKAAGLPYEHLRLGNPRGSAAFGDRRGLGAGEAMARKADARAADLADEIIGMRDRGLSYRDCCKELDAKGIKTARGGAWTPSAVRNIFLRKISCDSDKGGAE